ncbi:hypothetical protein CDAR_386371 [Caerostris darwini]|uniref:Uncharacterized protein n=1 Tax=Caerostris darwini TaxID=1538125 RepID=A0AAV4QGU4_9ARAC|nr:hypothetical protein CDAR_386371 [Caerostris darwini]
MSAEQPNPLRAVYWQRSLIPVSETPNRAALSIPVGDDEGLRRNSGLLPEILLMPPFNQGGGAIMKFLGERKFRSSPGKCVRFPSLKAGNGNNLESTKGL